MFAVMSIFACVLLGFGQSKYEFRRIDSARVSFDVGEPDLSDAERIRAIVAPLAGTIYSSTAVHDAITAIYDTRLAASVVVTASLNDKGGVALDFKVREKTRIDRVTVKVGETVGDKVTEQELLFKLNILESGVAVSDNVLRNNVDQILEYLRERGFYQSEATFVKTTAANVNDINAVFTVTPGVQARVEGVEIKIDGFPGTFSTEKLGLEAGGLYSRDRLDREMQTIRKVLRQKEFYAPFIDDPRVVYDSEKNLISVSITGRVGPAIKVSIDAMGKKQKVSEGSLNKLLPVKREGTLDYAAIVEGERRLETHFQELGYFFADVRAVCSVEPQLIDSNGQPMANGNEFLCSALGSSDLAEHKVDIKYNAYLNRKFNLRRMTIRGTSAMSIEDIRTVLSTQEANLLGVIPLFGYGRGYTSTPTLEADAATIASLMAELGYREAEVHVNQGVGITSDDLIITFQVDEGPRTFVRNVTIAGNKAVSDATLRAVLPPLAGEAYSRAKFRNATRKLSEYYSEQGFYDARVSFTVSEVPAIPNSETRRIDIEFKVENEGTPVRINRVLVDGQKNVRPSAVLRASPLRTGNLLRSRDVYATEQNLYATDAFDKITVKPREVGRTDSGEKLSDLIINVSEQPARLMTYGGGFSTELGPNGFFDIRHVDLLGKLWQGGARVRLSRRQQLAQLDLFNPRFIREKDKFAPLTISVQYQRDSTVTRFFRSAFDKGTFGIVQRIDEHGVPIDEFGNAAGRPTINRLTLSAETSRTLSRRDRSILFVRYRFEDVRLQNIESLLIKDLLMPDRRVRISGFGATFARDTRTNCTRAYSLLELIEKGELGDPCRYNASDPTNGSYITAEYNVSIPQLGANIGFHKFQASYNHYYTLTKLHNTTLAGRAVIGLAQAFSARNRFGTDPNLRDLNGLLPVSERFFAGGSNTLRGFNFEEAGPRVVVVPEGTFRNSSGQIVTLDPFTIPFGGNALAIVNLEARIPLTKTLRAVPFYDGGNVFRRIGDIFKPPQVPANDLLRRNLRALWTNTVGLGLRLKTPVGGELGVDVGYLLNPPQFLIPQGTAPPATYRLQQTQIHFRFAQAF